MPLEDDILEFLIFCSFQVYKNVERDKMTSLGGLLRAVQTCTKKYSRMAGRPVQVGR